MSEEHIEPPGGCDEGPRDGDPHDVAPPTEWPWLPTQEDSGLAKHPYCEDCGAIKVLGRESGLPIGTLTNILGRIKRRLRDDGHTITEAQTRLILQRLRQTGGDDDFAVPRSRQLQLLAEAVEEYTNIEARRVWTVLRSC